MSEWVQFLNHEKERDNTEYSKKTMQFLYFRIWTRRKLSEENKKEKQRCLSDVDKSH